MISIITILFSVVSCALYHTVAQVLPSKPAVRRPLWSGSEAELSLYLQENSATFLQRNKKFKSKAITSPTKEGIVTLFKLASELPALEVFVYSFVQHHIAHSPRVRPLVIATQAPHVDLVMGVLRKYNAVLWWEVYLWSDFKGDSFNSLEGMLALQTWTMTSFHRLVFMDINMLILNCLDEIFAYNTSTNGFLGSLEWNRMISPEQRSIHSSVFLVKPSRQVLQEIASFHYAVDEQSSAGLSLNAVFNQFFSSNNCCLPPTFNMNIAVSRYWTELWNITDIHAIRFIGEMPWTVWSTPLFREEARKKRNKVTRKANQEHYRIGNADDYQALHRLWKQYYFQARKHEFQDLTMFAGYHSEENWPLLTSSHVYEVVNVRLAGLLRPNSHDIDGPEEVQLIRQPAMQKQIGEYGTILAAAQLAKTKFVGITSWKNPIKANIGASIDWTKVDFQDNTVYFWLGLRTRESFYKYNAGIYGLYPNVTEKCTSFPLPVMEADIYAFAHYFIMSKTLLDRYVQDTNRFIAAYMKTYPNLTTNGCPIMYGKKSDRCLGYTLERNFNVWIAHHNISRVFAVDALTKAEVDANIQ